jgi:UDP-N-acetylglucosamine diphosphorylase / glucose-1-phosphate thymidylyltransferase / UDP-N-acetylgalactosamine diphosphorylase / glucosamine-1-phosphate N-acetyltransferase / galactosamine-1-phosphate N-acetyltransferase
MQIYRYVIEDLRHVPPFNEPASYLTIGLKELKIHHEDLFDDLFLTGRAYDEILLGPALSQRDQIRSIDVPAIVYRDSLWFDREFLTYFWEEARRRKRACRAAFRADDPAFRTYTLPLTTTFEPAKGPDGEAIYLVDLWYLPKGYEPNPEPIIVPSDAKEKGFYSVPDFMTMEQGDLTHYLPTRAVLSIESWVHVYYASVIFGNFARASRFDDRVAQHNFFSLKLLWRAVLEMKQVLSTSAAVKVGRGTVIHPTAVITGPAEIGDNCVIGPGVMLDNCTIGNNVTVDDGCVLMMSTVADGCFLPFRASLYLTSVMENSIIAQNTCLQMCAIGRRTFVGAGNTFTDFNLIEQKPIKAMNIEGELEPVGQIVMGSGIGHNVRIGSGVVVYPGRTIESDVVMVATADRRVIMRNVTYEESDHHRYMSSSHARFYPRKNKNEVAAEEDW